MRLKAPLLIVGLLGTLANADLNTTRAGIVKPTIGSTGWGVKTNNNWDIVDSSAAFLGTANIFTSTSTYYGPVFLPSLTSGSGNCVGVDGIGKAITVPCGSGGGATALGVNSNGLVVSSPTAQINFVGTGVTVTSAGSTATVTISGGSGSLGVDYNGVAVTTPTAQLNFTGPGVFITSSGTVANIFVSSAAFAGGPITSSSITVSGSGTGVISLREGVTVSSNVLVANNDTIYADSASHALKTGLNGGTTYFIVVSTISQFSSGSGSGGPGGTYLGLVLVDSTTAKWGVTVSTNGALTTTSISSIPLGYLNLNPFVLTDPCASYWKMTVDATSHLVTASSGSYNSSVERIAVNDSSGNAWLVTASTSGALVTSGNGQFIPAVSCPNSSGAITQPGTANLFVGNAGNLTVASPNNTCAGQNSCIGVTSGSGGNTGYGYGSCKNVTTGVANTCLGFNAGDSVTTGSFGVYIGDEAGTFLTTGAQDILIGESAGFSLGAGNLDTLIGYNAGVSMTSSSNRNTVLGASSAGQITTGSSNTCIGSQTCGNTVAGSSNTVIGANATEIDSTGNNQGVVLLGYGASTGNVPNLTNALAIGLNSIVSSSNTATIGGPTNASNAVTLIVSSVTTNLVSLPLSLGSGNAGNVNFGSTAYLKMTVNNSVYAGFQAGAPFGTEEVAIGDHAGGSANKTGAVAIGNYAGYGGGSETVAIGDGALGQNSTTTQPYNVAVGYLSQTASSAIGTNNVSVGAYTMDDPSFSGYQSTALGAYALHANTSANYNVGVGYRSLYANTIGSNNTAIGNWALNYTTNSVNNVAIGDAAGGDDTETGGQGAAKFATACTFLGASSGVASTGTIITNCTAVGNGARVTTSNHMQLGSSGVIVDLTNAVASGYYQLSPRTIAQLRALTPTATNQEYGCSDCTVDSIAVSTGTLTGAFAEAGSKTTFPH